VNHKLSSLRLLGRATAALAIGACGTIHNLGDNPNTGGETNVTSGGASDVASGGVTALGGTGGTSSISNLASRTLAQCNIPNVGSFNEQLISIPSELTGPNWSVKADNCQQGGWNLAQCAGQTATFTSFDTGMTNQWGPITAWVAAVGDTVCCVYESDNSNPGILPASCGAGGAPGTGGTGPIGGAGGTSGGAPNGGISWVSTTQTTGGNLGSGGSTPNVSWVSTTQTTGGNLGSGGSAPTGGVVGNGGASSDNSDRVARLTASCEASGGVVETWQCCAGTIDFAPRMCNGTDLCGWCPDTKPTLECGCSVGCFDGTSCVSH